MGWKVFCFHKEHDTKDAVAWMYSLGKLLWADNSVFDLGIGIGFLANITAQIGYLSISIDISKEMMNYAIRHVKATGLMQFIWKGNALDLPFMDNSVDFIMQGLSGQLLNRCLNNRMAKSDKARRFSALTGCRKASDWHQIRWIFMRTMRSIRKWPIKKPGRKFWKIW